MTVRPIPPCPPATPVPDRPVGARTAVRMHAAAAATTAAAAAVLGAAPIAAIAAMAFAAAPLAASAASPQGPAGAASAARPAGTQPRPDAIELGRREYEDNCATCHGMEARGDGPMRPFLARPPADLTALAQRHGGTFPRSLVADLIDGRGMASPGPHGTRDMPVWGRVFREQSDAQTRGTPFPPEWSVRGRIVALVDYLQTLQRP